ncbi:MAG: hypothetical protein HZC42_13885 [Candidatus Eisenbacteria bacterium]|nr:hypothetical protein [Candidatus Eisenbacteria bacterium]
MNPRQGFRRRRAASLVRAALAPACLASILVLGAGRASAPAPPPAAPGDPAPRRGHPLDPRLVIANDVGDSIVLEADTLQMTSHWGKAINEVRRPTRFRTAAGEWVTLDGETPAGDYRLPDGGTIMVHPGNGYPRYTSWFGPEQPTLWWRIRTQAQVAALGCGPCAGALDSTGGPTDPLARYFEPLPGDAIFDVPATWYAANWTRRCHTVTPDSAGPIYHVVWIAYGKPQWPVEREAVRQDGRVIGGAVIDCVMRRVIATWGGRREDR